MRLDFFLTAIFIMVSALFIIIVLLNTAFGVFYDTDHFADTQFLLGAAWRVHQGLTPVIDFSHFYGGFIEQGISWTMSLFGYSVFVFDYFTILLGLFLSACAFLVLRPQISWPGFAAVVLVLTTLVLTRFPLEVSSSITHIVSTHSFLYNRFALAVFVVLGLFVALPASTSSFETFRAVLMGVLVGLVCLTKSTFVILPVGVLLALLVLSRWRALLGLLGGIALVFLVFDPTLERLIGSFNYAIAHVGSSNDVTGLIRKAVQVPLAQPVALSLAVGGLGYLVHRRDVTRYVIALLGFAATGAALTATMGGNGSLGHLGLPIAIMVSLAVSELTQREAMAHSETFRAMTVCLILAFVMPHLLNLGGAAAEGIAKRGALQITEGPFIDYLSLPEDVTQQNATQYDTLADGITALQKLGDPTEWGIVANNGVSFEYALMARPVPAYPLWQRTTAPEFAPNHPFAPSSDIVMLRPSDQQDPLGLILREKMDDAFILCTTSRHWEIYRRLALNLPTCDAL